MATANKEAARLVAAFHGIRRVPANDYTYAQPLRRFLEAFLVASRPARPIHLALPASQPGGPAVAAYHEALLGKTGIEDLDRLSVGLLRAPAGRTWNLYGAIIDGRPAVGLHSYVDGDGRPWTRESLAEAVEGGDIGMLDPVRDSFRNPYVVGRARSLAAEASPLWKMCSEPQAEPARLAWECLTGQPWLWHYKLRHTEDLYERDSADAERDPFRQNPASRLHETRKRRLREVARQATKIYPEYRPFPDYIPMRAFLTLDPDDKRSWLGVLAYYLIEDPTGPGLPPEQARRALGAKNRRHVTRALDTFLKKHPEARRWPGPHRDQGPRISLGSGSTMAHH